MLHAKSVAAALGVAAILSSGGALAGRALTQAEKFGAEVVVAKTAVRLHCDRRPYAVELSDGAKVNARAIVIATGAAYRKLSVAGLS